MWNEVVGHARQIEELKRTIADGRLPGAWLFAGMRGIGKRFVATRVAAAVCCTGAVAPCGSCAACAKVMAGNHPDVFVVEPDGERIKIDQLRSLSQRLQFHPLEARAKIAIIDDADTMTDAAANSLLKILEEPPSATHFILVSASAHRLLSTIRSRCRRIVFAPLADEDVARCLVSGGFDDHAARRAARYAQGSLGCAQAFVPDFIDEVVGRFEALGRRASASDIIMTSEAWASDASRIVPIIDLLVGWHRDRLRTIQGAGGNDGEINALLRRLDLLAATRDAAETTANKQLMFEQLLFSVTAV